MTEITIKLDKEAIYTEVRKLAGYSGKKKTDATDDVTYDVTHITKKEEEMLDQYWDEAEAVLLDLLKTYYKSGTAETGIVCQMPQNWDENLLETTIKSAQNYMQSYIVSKWFRLNMKDKVEEKAGDAVNQLAELKRKVYYRKRP